MEKARPQVADSSPMIARLSPTSQDEHRAALMDRLNDDIYAQIREAGGSVISRSGDPLSGLVFRYGLGKGLENAIYNSRARLGSGLYSV
jgi:hypothetical protein